MAKSKKSAAPSPSASETNMAAAIVQANGATATLEAPPGAGPAVYPAPASRKQNGQFTQDQETRRQAAMAKADAARKEADERADANLDKLFGDDPDEPKPKPAKSTESAQDEAQPADEAEAKNETTDQPKKSDEATEQALDKALAVLRLDGWTTDDLRELSTERLVALAAKASKRQADVSNKIRELTESAKTASTVATADPEPASQPGFDVSAAIKEAVDVLGGDTAPALTKLVGDVTGFASKRIEAQSAELASMRSQMGYLLASEARRELQGEYPELANPERYLPVLEKTAQLWNKGQGGYDSLREAMSDAARIKLGDPIRERADASEVRRKRDAGQARSETNAVKPPKAKTIDERQDDILDRLFAGDEDGARKVARG